MEKDFELIETVFKGALLALFIWLWLPALLAKKLFDKLYEE